MKMSSDNLKANTNQTDNTQSDMALYQFNQYNLNNPLEQVIQQVGPPHQFNPMQFNPVNFNPVNFNPTQFNPVNFNQMEYPELLYSGYNSGYNSEYNSGYNNIQQCNAPPIQYPERLIQYPEELQVDINPDIKIYEQKLREIKKHEKEILERLEYTKTKKNHYEKVLHDLYAEQRDKHNRYDYNDYDNYNNYTNHRDQLNLNRYNNSDKYTIEKQYYKKSSSKKSRSRSISPSRKINNHVVPPVRKTRSRSISPVRKLTAHDVLYSRKIKNHPDYDSRSYSILNDEEKQINKEIFNNTSFDTHVANGDKINANTKYNEKNYAYLKAYRELCYLAYFNREKSFDGCLRYILDKIRKVISKKYKCIIINNLYFMHSGIDETDCIEIWNCLVSMIKKYYPNIRISFIQVDCFIDNKSFIKDDDKMHIQQQYKDIIKYNKLAAVRKVFIDADSIL